VRIAYNPELYGSLVGLTSKVVFANSAKQNMKIISKKYWQDMTNFVEQISIKFEVFFLVLMNLLRIVQ